MSFPTETVYGLGANALVAEACQKIFTSKGRPLTDPLIVHVHSLEQGLSLIDQSEPEIVSLFSTLAGKYWPGPLTMVVKANLELIPLMITAQTGYVGIRLPNHEIACELLRTAGVPVAAPSANKFGHVSPSRAQHVYNDFHKDTDVLIIDGGECSFGIESTVLKMEIESGERPEDPKRYKLLIIRKGGVSLENFNQRLAECGLADRTTISQLQRKHAKPETENLEAPGQFLRHYSPDIVSYLYQGGACQSAEMDIGKAIVLDFGQIHAEFASQAKHYMDLSAEADFLQAIHNVYDALRWAETNTDAEYVLITDIVHYRDRF